MIHVVNWRASCSLKQVATLTALPPTRTRFFGVKITSREDKKVSMNFKVSVGIGN